MAQTRMLDATAEFSRRHGLGEGHSISIAPENNSPLVIFLLSDLSKSVNGQVVRVQGRSMNLGTHPAALNPGVECDNWTVKEVAKAFGTRLAKQQLPLGVQSYDVKVHSYSVPYTRGGSADRRKKAAAPARKPASRAKAGRAKPAKAKRAKKR
jgi:hypothetical protein